MTERKYLAHYIDSAFDTTYAACTYVRLGKSEKGAETVYVSDKGETDLPEGEIFIQLI